MLSRLKTTATVALFAATVAAGATALATLVVSPTASAAADPTAFAVVAMAAFFTAVVRAPITGIILATEMTGSFTLLLPMLTSCFAAMIVPSMLHCPPIYDSLRDRMPQRKSDPAH